MITKGKRKAYKKSSVMRTRVAKVITIIENSNNKLTDNSYEYLFQFQRVEGEFHFQR